jgi:hypothetical protein
MTATTTWACCIPRWSHSQATSSVPPIGATVSAATSGNIQAWQYRCGFAIQFHPEVTDDILRRWCATAEHELKKQGVDPDSFFAHRPAGDVPRVANLLQHVLSTTERNTNVNREPHRPCHRTG